MLQILNLTPSLCINKLDVWILPWDDVITSKRKQTFGFALFDIFFKIIAHQSRYAGGFYDVKSTWWAIDLKKYKTFAYHHLSFDAHCCHKGTAIKHAVPDWRKSRHLKFMTSGHSDAPGHQRVKNYSDSDRHNYQKLHDITQKIIRPMTDNNIFTQYVIIPQYLYYNAHNSNTFTQVINILCNCPCKPKAIICWRPSS